MEKPWGYHDEWSALVGPAAKKNPWGLQPLGFWSWDLPRHSSHQDTPLALPNNVTILLLCYSRNGEQYFVLNPHGTN